MSPMADVLEEGAHPSLRREGFRRKETLAGLLG